MALNMPEYPHGNHPDLILAVKHDTLDVFLEGRERPDSNIPEPGATAWTALWRTATCTASHRPAVRGVRLHVEPSPEGCQMCIICRRNN